MNILVILAHFSHLLVFFINDDVILYGLSYVGLILRGKTKWCLNINACVLNDFYVHRRRNWNNVIKKSIEKCNKKAR